MSLRSIVSVATLLAAVAGALPAHAHAQTVTPRCSAFTATGCATLRVDLTAAAGAPLALHTFAAELAGGYTFAAIGGGSTAAFTGADAFSFGVPFTGTAALRGTRNLLIDFLASPGFAFELEPDGAGYLEFALDGAGDDLTVRFDARDPDGVTAASGDVAVVATPAAVVPEPSTVALLAGGLCALALFGRRRVRWEA